jgi:hypothetical protein
MRKLKGQIFEKIEAEKVNLEKIREAAARRGGEGNDNPFMALCNSGVTLLSCAEDYVMPIPPFRDWEVEKRMDAAEWQKETEKELRDLKSYEDVDEFPEGTQLIECRWVYEFKIDESGGPPIYKTHPVAQSLSQVPFVDYGATFVPVAKSNSDWDLQCFDTTRTFLCIVIFMRQPPPLPPGLCRLVMWIHQEMYIDSLLAKHDRCR